MQMATFVTIVRRGRGRRVVLHYRVMPQRGEERAEAHALGEEVRDDDVYRLPLCGCAAPGETVEHVFSPGQHHSVCQRCTFP